MKSVAAGHVTDSTQPASVAAAIEVVMVYGMDIYRYPVNDANVGAGSIASSEFARTNLSFSDVISVRASPSSAETYLMGSAPNGDDTVYHLDLSKSAHNSAKEASSPAWVTEVETRGWQGRIASINKAVDV
jgi:hypothetical protein